MLSTLLSAYCLTKQWLLWIFINPSPYPLFMKLSNILRNRPTHSKCEMQEGSKYAKSAFRTGCLNAPKASFSAIHAYFKKHWLLLLPSKRWIFEMHPLNTSLIFQIRYFGCFHINYCVVSTRSNLYKGWHQTSCLNAATLLVKTACELDCFHINWYPCGYCIMHDTMLGRLYM